jgi:hypothetical protein
MMLGDVENFSLVSSSIEISETSARDTLTREVASASRVW